MEADRSIPLVFTRRPGESARPASLTRGSGSVIQGPSQAKGQAGWGHQRVMTCVSSKQQRGMAARRVGTACSHSRAPGTQVAAPQPHWTSQLRGRPAPSPGLDVKIRTEAAGMWRYP